MYKLGERHPKRSNYDPYSLAYSLPSSAQTSPTPTPGHQWHLSLLKVLVCLAAIKALSMLIPIMSNNIPTSHRSWCPEDFNLERHTHDSQHGDVCRGPKLSHECPEGCYRRFESPFCSSEDVKDPCRVPWEKNEKPYVCDPFGGHRGVCILATDSIAPSQKRYRDHTCDGSCGLTKVVQCKDEWDCSLAGTCSNGQCQCDPWADGPDCSYLNFQPVDPHKVGYLFDTPYSSWGGTAVWDGNNTWHMYVSEILCEQGDSHRSRCGLQTWETLSQIAHLVSDDVQGPYRRLDTLLLPEHHNPSLHVSPVDGSWNLYTISGPRGPIEVISSTNQGQDWSPPITISKGQNPGPLLHRDGTVTLFYRDDTTDKLTPDTCSTEHIQKLQCPSRTDQCAYPMLSQLLFHHTAEDPSVFVDHRGNHHMLVNALPYNCLPKHQQGGHAWSRDGETWSQLRVGAFNTTIRFTDDDSVMTCERRERPQMIMDPDRTGVPLALVTGVTGCPTQFVTHNGKSDCFTLVQLMRQ